MLAPLAEPTPTGVNLKHGNALHDLRRLREEDDASLPMGVWQRELKRSDWHQVEALACSLLSSQSKDLQVAAWLGEAWIHRYDLLGLSSALELLAELLERYPDTLYPKGPDGDMDWLAGPLSWIAKNYSQLAHMKMELPGKDEERSGITLYLWESTQQRLVLQGGDSRQKQNQAEAQQQYRELCETLSSLPLESLLMQRHLVEEAQALVNRLECWIDDHLSDDPPSLQALHDRLSRWQRLLEEAMKLHPDQVEPEIQPPDQEPLTGTTETAMSDKAIEAANPYSRQQAYRQLKDIANFLRQTEPHSPVPYLLDTAVSWGNMTLQELLLDILSAGIDERKIWEKIGVIPKQS
ncbi:type VI secretion system protein TssA [Pseudomonas oryzihabitans]|uniref:type VI secretion system protein TssA n=1 Tax=Pseudomonas oryzihabitans TaxID=47885 RepID=UPI002893F25E|nr:type VI secretion system protein TssA [Pseudomonas oryzihabitans]MDT3717918.1 type VI secretion system protein TssA [Pseudomonas oryzihabitans]